uniref:Juvenile hormone acid O-methyltransferase n=1 Tax=Planococcus kraunhiae TaxID=494597 RepID=A0A146J3Z5_9HEMI|nr:juvenile hormone acid O-methyltransferase [Planococcus kraunhiae]
MTSGALFRLSQAQTYYSYHGMQDRDADIALQKYKPKMKWNSKHKILDIGCGPGDLTYNYLLPLIPSNGEMLGIDISPAMINYANSKYKDSRLNFEVMDISNPKVAEKYKLNFDSVFSFYCLHWIQDQRSTMRNIYSILKPGGETLLIFLATSPIYRLYELLAASPKWSPYMKNYRDVISPYHYSADPVSDIKNLMQSVGFHVKECFCTPTSYTVPSKQVLYKSIEAVNPFLSLIPEHMLKEYDQDWKEKMWKSNLCTLLETNEVTFKYSLITIYAYKPH